jgi:hypothetical protein
MAFAPWLAARYDSPPDTCIPWLTSLTPPQFSEIDHTTKLFATGRGDYRAVFEPTYACNPDTGALQIELTFIEWQNQPTGGHICVRHAFDGSHEFRYSPPGNTRTSLPRPSPRPLAHSSKPH